MGLESRLTDLRGLMTGLPTLDASKKWEVDENRGKGYWREVNAEVRSKTEKVIDAKVLYEATKEHPAQVKEYTSDVVVGEFTTQNFSSAITSLQKANMISVIDDLIMSAKAARVKANQTEVDPIDCANKIIDVIMAPLRA